MSIPYREGTTIIVSAEVDSDVVKMLKNSNIIVAPKFTKNAIEFMETHDIGYVTINTPLKEYKKYLSNVIHTTPLGTLVQAPNLSELDKDTFKVVSKTKPMVLCGVEDLILVETDEVVMVMKKEDVGRISELRTSIA